MCVLRVATCLARIIAPAEPCFVVYTYTRVYLSVRGYSSIDQLALAKSFDGRCLFIF